VCGGGGGICTGVPVIMEFTGVPSLNQLLSLPHPRQAHHHLSCCKLFRRRHSSNDDVTLYLINFRSKRAYFCHQWEFASKFRRAFRTKEIGDSAHFTYIFYFSTLLTLDSWLFGSGLWGVFFDQIRLLLSILFIVVVLILLFDFFDLALLIVNHLNLDFKCRDLTFEY
jgi:hypothetical protein